MATPIAHKGVKAGAQVVAMTVMDVLLRPDVIAAARDYFTNVQTKNRKYVPLPLQDIPRATRHHLSDDSPGAAEDDSPRRPVSSVVSSLTPAMTCVGERLSSSALVA